MTPKVLFEKLPGHWEGICRTWFEPDELADESNVTGTIVPVLGGRFLRHTYQGTIQAKARHGEELIAFNAIKEIYETSWVDDFHMNYAIMFSQGDASDRGFVVHGAFDVGKDQPRWGWKTVFDSVDDEHLTIAAYNISPEGVEAQALETRYVRRSKICIG
jgi:hypothetical protein